VFGIPFEEGCGEFHLIFNKELATEDTELLEKRLLNLFFSL
jgi:hypothetical protein